MIWENIESKIEVMYKEFPDQPKEIEEGNKEYKWKIFPIRFDSKRTSIENNRNVDVKCEKLASQMHWRCCEGDGNAVYILGIEDNGNSVGIEKNEMFRTLLFIIKAADIIDATINKIRLYRGPDGTIATVRISLDVEEIKTL